MSARHFDLEPALNRLNAELNDLLAALPLFVLALVCVAVAWLVGRWLSRRAVIDRFGSRNPFLRELGRTTVRWAVTLLGLLVALEIMNATALVGALMGTAGVLGIALGFAFKDTLENYLAGILMSLRQPFAPDDHVVIDGNEGLVVAMTSRATILMTLDGNHLRLPNALVFRGVTLNYTRNPRRRFEFDLGIGLDQDLLAAQTIGREALFALPGVLDEPPPRSQIIAIGDSSAQVRYLGWVDQRSHDFGMVRSEAIRHVKTALDTAGIDMPEPGYRVHWVRGAGAPPSSRTPASSAGDVDTRRNDDIADQVDRDPLRDGSADLLDPKAPRE